MSMWIGRTTCIGLRSIAQAISHPNKKFILKDHENGNVDELAQFIQHVATKLNLSNIKVKMTGNSYIITSIMPGGYDE